MHVQYPVAAGGQGGVVSDEHERGAVLLFAAEQKLNDVRTGRFVEIAGGLVGDENCRIGRKRPRNGVALLLATGQLRWIMVDAIAQSDCRQLAFGARESIAGAGQFKRHRAVLQRSHGRNEMEGLKDDADIGSAKARKFVFVEVAKVSPGTQ